MESGRKPIIIGAVVVAVIGLAYWMFHTPSDFIAARRKHSTHLVVKQFSPDRYKNPIPSDEMRLIEYSSNGQKLKAWYLPGKGSGRRPAIAYLHGGWSLSVEDVEAMQPFLDAGFVVFTPTFRAENGNLGNFEMMYGELDDARAAVKWLMQQPEVDPKNVFVFGHSSGGILAALMSIYPDCGARLTGSAGGMQDESLFDEGKVPFDVNSEVETRLRVVPPNAGQIKVPHIAYVGDEDVHVMDGAKKAQAEAAKTKAPLTVKTVPGEHQAMLEPAIKMFLQDAQAAMQK